MMSDLYSIRGWDRRYETHETRKVKSRLRYVYIPTSHDGKAYRRLMSLPDGVAIFGVWILLLEIAAKCPERGVLADDDGPLTAEDVASITGAPVEIVTRSLDVLSSDRIGWISRNLPKGRETTGDFREEAGGSGRCEAEAIETTSQTPKISRNLPEPPAVLDRTRQDRTGLDKTGQDSRRQDGTGPDRKGRDGTGQEGTGEGTGRAVAPLAATPGAPEPEGTKPKLAPDLEARKRRLKAQLAAVDRATH